MVPEVWATLLLADNAATSFLQLFPACSLAVRLEAAGPRLNIKTVFSRYGDSHVKIKTVARLYW